MNHWRCRRFVRRVEATGLALLTALLTAGLFHAQPALAATFTVTTTQDAPHTTPLDGNCTSTLAGTPCTLRAAIQAANFLGGSHTINLAMAGTYTLTVTGANEDNAATGDLDINGVTLSIANTSASSVTIDGNNADRIFDVGPLAAAQLSLSGLTLQHGRVPSSETGPGGGGAIRVSRVSTLSLADMTLSGNGTEVGGGGAIANHGALEVARAVIAQNSTLVVPASGGGGIFNDGTLTLTDVTISANVAPSGGGLEHLGRDTATLDRVALVNNSGVGDGGGIFNVGTMAVTDTTVSGNASPAFRSDSHGGGIANRGSLTLTNVTVSQNRAPGGGGSPGTGGGIDNSFPGATVSVSNVILANNTNATGPDNCSGSITSLGGNLSSDGTCPLTAGSDQVNTDPQLGPLQNNGGLTPTQALLTGSPAIEAGTNAGCPATDQRGVPRPQGARCDIGAYEALLACTAQAPVNVSVVPGSPGQLRATVTATTTTTTPTNQLRTLRFGPAAGALVDVPGQPPGQTGNFTVSLPPNTPSIAFVVRQATAGQAATVPLTVTDACGDWPTLVGGGAQAFPTSGPSAPAPAPTAPAAPAPPPAGVPSGTSGSTPDSAPVACSPRPPVRVTTAASGAGQFQVTIAASGAGNSLQALRFGTASNAHIEAGAQSGSGSFTVLLAPGIQQTTFTVMRLAAGQPVTVNLVAVDTCGDWPTVVGAGASTP